MKWSLVQGKSLSLLPTRRSALDRLARAVILERLRRLQTGALTIVDDGEHHCFGKRHTDTQLHATLTIHDARAFRDVLFGGNIGAGESYVLGRWSCDNLTGLVQILLRNQAVLYGMNRGLSRLTDGLNRLLHWMRRNTPGGSRRNIATHYDIGNDLFSLFLDETMMYSCGIFENAATTSLHQASVAKLDLICRKLQLGPGDHVLEIGTGWGGFAMHAARHYGCRVTTTTISRQQYELARQRVAEAGLAQRVEVLFRDYRELTGQYDKLVSIEMIEAIGHRYFDTYFEQCGALLKPHGMLLLQAITIGDQRYPVARRSVDFIQRYIFPGGCLPCVSVLAGAVARNTDMRLVQLDEIGPHYATTLRRWRERFHANLVKVKALGYNDRFTRLWEYYLCYCEGGFLERHIGTVQLLLAKPLCRQEPGLPRPAIPESAARPLSSTGGSSSELRGAP
jgi:cyclopropane-fatty-acyl-phospholipid synthase